MALHLVIFGRQGAGKGTQSQLLVDAYGVVHVSTGDMLRAAVKAESPVGLLAKDVIDRGDLVSDDIIIELVKERIAEPDCTRGFLFDGFPRTLAQAESLKTG